MFMFFPVAVMTAVGLGLVGEGIIAVVQLGCSAAACASPIGHGIVAAISCVIGTGLSYKIICTNDCYSDGDSE